ncbi:MAG: alpha/beta hydrolase [Planctomycetota bacterium]
MNSKPLRCIATFLLATLATITAMAREPTVHRGIEFARVDDRPLRLDLYLPSDAKAELGVIVWVHGGRWSRGSRASVPSGLLKIGYPVASVDYRLSTEAKFPAQIHDIKAAIRFLRGHATSFGLDTRTVTIAGSSAGGHLAALVGVTNGHSQLEGRLGDELQQSSSVQAILDFYGPTNFMTILEQSTLHGYKVRAPALALLLNGEPATHAEQAKLASPVFHVDPSDPPILIVHGDQDIQVPINQAHELQGAYNAKGLKAVFEVIHGAGHGGDAFFDQRMQTVIKSFLASAHRSEHGE